MIRKLVRFIVRGSARRLYFLLMKAAHQEKLKAAVPGFVRKFISRFIVRAVADTYDRERRLQRVDESTILLADYRRCGVAWLRFTLMTVLHYRATGEFRKLAHQELGNYCATIHGHENFNPYRFNNGMSFLKTHSHYYPEFHRAIMIYRNSYEAIKSLYTHERYALDNISTLYEFDLFRGTDREKVPLSGDKIEGLSEDESFLVFWSREYVRHHETWLAAIRERPDDFIVFKYEDMLENCAGLLPAMISFAGLDTPPLTTEQISTLAAMYTRGYSNWPKDEDISYRNNKFVELESVINPSELERLDAPLARRIDEIHTELDDVRQPSSP
ncbi:MAG: hypothetical protein HOM52_17845 [Rhodospirillaceae bacterium]|nr:hypothetical protein [Rhodospirillaceae bacterium]